MATKRVASRESLDLLVEAFDRLDRAGKNTLVRAYEFGQVALALNGISRTLYSWKVLGSAVDRSGPVVKAYAHLAERYPTVRALLDMSERLDTVDYHKLAYLDEAQSSWHFAMECTNCGHRDEFRKVREPRGSDLAVTPPEQELAMAQEIEFALQRRGHPAG